MRAVTKLIVLAVFSVAFVASPGALTVPTGVLGSNTASKTFAGEVKVTMALSNRYVPIRKNSSIYLHIGLDAIKAATVKPLPLNVSLVIDRSGSMMGQKIVDAKKAAIAALAQLKNGDRFSLVTYSTGVRVDVPSIVVSSDNRNRIKQMIYGIHASGSTNLSGGMLAGKKQVLQYVRSNWVNRVLLISDGRANVGISDPRMLNALSRRSLQQGVAISTIGVGNDYNETLMTGIADYGGGNYYYVGNSTELAGIFNKELKEMATTIAQNVSLEIKLAPGTTLDRLFGYKHTLEKSTVVIPLAELFSGQKRSIIAKLAIHGAANDNLPVVSLRVSYHSAAKKKRLAHKGTLMVTPTDSRKLLDKGENSDVMIRVQEIRISTSIDKAMNLFEKGDADGADRLLQRTLDRTERHNKRYKSKRLRGRLGMVRKMKKKMRIVRRKPSSKKSFLKGGRYDAYKLSK